VNAASLPVSMDSPALDPFAPTYEPSEGIPKPESYRSGAPSEYRCSRSAPPHLLVGCVREQNSGKPVPALVEIWHQLELNEGHFDFSYPATSQDHPWDTDWRGRMCCKVRGGFAFTLSHPSSDQKIRPVFLRVTSPGFVPVFVETFPEPWSDISSVEVVLQKELSDGPRAE
jgi:hypothetical protein